MATITLNADAPDNVKFILGNTDFELDRGGSYETDDREVLADAKAHAYLTVKDTVEKEPDTAPAEAEVAPAFKPFEVAK